MICERRGSRRSIDVLRFPLTRGSWSRCPIWGLGFFDSPWIELGQTDGWGRRRRDYHVKHDKPKRLFGRLLARLANSLFMEWRSHQRKPRHKSTPDFAARMAADHGRRLLFTLTARRPNLQSPS